MWKAANEGGDSRARTALRAPLRFAPLGTAFIPYVQRRETLQRRIREKKDKIKNPGRRNWRNEIYQFNGTRKRLSPVITRRTRFLAAFLPRRSLPYRHRPIPGRRAERERERRREKRVVGERGEGWLAVRRWCAEGWLFERLRCRASTLSITDKNGDRSRGTSDRLGPKLARGWLECKLSRLAGR